MTIIQHLIFASLVLTSFAPTAVAAAPKEQQKTQNSKPTQKKTTWKQKVSRKFKKTKQFVSDNREVIISGGIMLGAVAYTLHRRLPEIKQSIDRCKQAFAVNRAPRVAQDPEYIRAITAAAFNDQPRAMTELIQRQAQNRDAFRLWFNQRHLPLALNVHGNFRNAIYRNGEFYGNESQEQYQNARDRIDLFVRAARQRGVPSDIRTQHLVQELPADIATIGFHHLQNNPDRIRLMPQQTRASLINAMANRHADNLRLIADEIHHWEANNHPLAEANLFPTAEELRGIMTQRVNAIMQAPAPAQPAAVATAPTATRTGLTIAITIAAIAGTAYGCYKLYRYLKKPKERKTGSQPDVKKSGNRKPAFKNA
jgi:hypothetical protein